LVIFAGRGLRRETHGTPSAEIQASIGKLLGRGAVDDPQKMLSELARLGARLIMQLAVFGVVGREDEQIE
jgi:adenylosuccinate synthase